MLCVVNEFKKITLIHLPNFNVKCRKESKLSMGRDKCLQSFVLHQSVAISNRRKVTRLLELGKGFVLCLLLIGET